MRRYFLLILVIASFWVINLPVDAEAGKIVGTVKAQGLRSPADILVYVTETAPVTVDVSKAKFVMDQRDLTFNPHVLAVPVGAEVLFPNNDKVAHNVFSLSRTKKFNLGSYKSGESKTVLFDKPGVVQLRCDVHAEMGAYILVMKNPYFAVTDSQGRFEIPDRKFLEEKGIKGVKDLPAGKLDIRTWHEKLGSIRQEVDVPENGEVAVELNLTRGSSGALYK